MLINELSKRSGLSIYTLRYYENLGLIKGTTNENVKTNTYKHYDESLLEKLEIIKGAKEVGFTLSEIRNMVDSWYNNQLSMEEKLEVVDNKIKEIDSKIYQLKQVRKLLVEGRKDIENGEC